MADFVVVFVATVGRPRAAVSVLDFIDVGFEAIGFEGAVAGREASFFGGWKQKREELD